MQQRRLYLVLDLDETLVHSLRTSVRQISTSLQGAGQGEEAAAADGDDDDDDDGDLDHDGESGDEDEQLDGTAEDDESAHQPGTAAAAAAATAVAAKAATSRTQSQADDVRSTSSDECSLPVSLPSSLPSAIGPLLDGGVAASRDSSAGASVLGSPAASVAGSAAASVDGGSSSQPDDAFALGDGQEVTLQVQNVEFEMKLRPGVHAFLREMSHLFCIHLYTMGSSACASSPTPGTLRRTAARRLVPAASGPARARLRLVERPRTVLRAPCSNHTLSARGVRATGPPSPRSSPSDFHASACSGLQRRARHIPAACRPRASHAYSARGLLVHVYTTNCLPARHPTSHRPGQVLAWNPALDRTKKTLQRLLCVPELVLIVDDSPVAWANHLPNLVLIDRFVGSPTDNSLQRIGAHLKAIHKTYFGESPPQALPMPIGSSMPLPPSSGFYLPPAVSESSQQAHGAVSAAAASGRRIAPLATVPEGAVLPVGARSVDSTSRRPLPSRLCAVGSAIAGSLGSRSASRSPLVGPRVAPCAGGGGSADSADVDAGRGGGSGDDDADGGDGGSSSVCRGSSDDGQAADGPSQPQPLQPPQPPQPPLPPQQQLPPSARESQSGDESYSYSCSDISSRASSRR